MQQIITILMQPQCCRPREVHIQAFLSHSLPSSFVHALVIIFSLQRITGEVRDVYADFNELTLEITLEALFGIDTSNDSGEHCLFSGFVASSWQASFLGASA